MPICSANSTLPCAIAPGPPPLALRMATIRAIPTGSLAPASPSSRVPVVPVTSRRPSTEKTVAGSVGARAVPSRRLALHPNPKRTCAPTASPRPVTSVPATPSHNTRPATGRKRDSPMCIPPSNRSTTRATVTIRWSTLMLRDPRSGNRSADTEAASRNSAGLGICVRAVILLEPTASSSATAATTTTSANEVTSCIRAPGVGRSTPTRLPGTPEIHCSAGAHPGVWFRDLPSLRFQLHEEHVRLGAMRSTPPVRGFRRRCQEPLALSELLDRADLHDGVSSDEDLCGLHEHVVLVAADDEEAGQLLGGLRERAVGDQDVRVGPRLIVRAWLLSVSPAPPVTAPPRAASS